MPFQIPDSDIREAMDNHTPTSRAEVEAEVERYIALVRETFNSDTYPTIGSYGDHVEQLAACYRLLERLEGVMQWHMLTGPWRAEIDRRMPDLLRAIRREEDTH
jgi:hypothetical protein